MTPFPFLYIYLFTPSLKGIHRLLSWLGIFISIIKKKNIISQRNRWLPIFSYFFHESSDIYLSILTNTKTIISLFRSRIRLLEIGKTIPHRTYSNLIGLWQKNSYRHINTKFRIPPIAICFAFCVFYLQQHSNAVLYFVERKIFLSFKWMAFVFRLKLWSTCNAQFK